ncbi:carotenoid oxygenase family protein [Pseudomarimonas arenosa]|uniref:Carotenoid oxygenase family protein n=1 Tax=Pseudomarimonas arenosa TaxID=2774145 RepID=A0AAW3ZJY3_9GAMM|nr:carotenoid oxygenase family protein [Pseudomarimonas arenosa]MBD8525770.1 carotenoid oxygenase family protein [Pseudomarimonas arenosa]
MDRRRFMQGAALGAAALSLPGLGWGQSPGRAAADFNASLRDQPWLVGWRDAALQTGVPLELEVQGQIPAGLRGRLYRNGPGLFSRADLRYRHWFDGDGLIQAWNIDQGGVQHRARFIATSKYRSEQATGRFTRPAAGTRVPAAKPIRNSDDLNTANTSVIEHAGSLYALWEGGSAHQLNADSLETLGPKIWREDLQGVPFSAHPLHDAAGHLWNVGVFGNNLLVWQIEQDGELRDIQRIETPFPGYLHAFSMTGPFLIFVLMPYVFDPREAGASYFESLHWQPERGCRVLVVDVQNGFKQRWYGLPAGAAYHFGPARQVGRELMVEACWSRNGKEMISPFAAEMRGISRRLDVGSSLQRIVIGLDNGRCYSETVRSGGQDFPVWDARAPSGSMFVLDDGDHSTSGCFRGISRIDLQRGAVDHFDYGDHCMVEEHRFVADPARPRPGAGWLVGTVLDWRRQQSGLSILDAERLSAGPLAQAWLPHALPLGFHGWFAATA